LKKKMTLKCHFYMLINTTAIEKYITSDTASTIVVINGEAI